MPIRPIFQQPLLAFGVQIKQFHTLLYLRKGKLPISSKGSPSGNRNDDDNRYTTENERDISRRISSAHTGHLDKSRSVVPCTDLDEQRWPNATCSDRSHRVRSVPEHRSAGKRLGPVSRRMIQKQRLVAETTFPRSNVIMYAMFPRYGSAKKEQRREVHNREHRVSKKRSMDAWN